VKMIMQYIGMHTHAELTVQYCRWL
jgi:hypothetical protein